MECQCYFLGRKFKISIIFVRRGIVIEILFPISLPHFSLALDLISRTTVLYSVKLYIVHNWIPLCCSNVAGNVGLGLEKSDINVNKVVCLLKAIQLSHNKVRFHLRRMRERKRNVVPKKQFCRRIISFEPKSYKCHIKEVENYSFILEFTSDRCFVTKEEKGLWTAPSRLFSVGLLGLLRLSLLQFGVFSGLYRMNATI